MTFDVSAIPTQSPAPTMQADLRPTADIAALVRDPQPNVPMPVPASMVQSGAVTQSKLASSPEQTPLEELSTTERVLKPYGVAMLPETAHQAERIPTEEDEDGVTRDEQSKSVSEDERLNERQAGPLNERSKGPDRTEPVGRPNTDEET